MKFCFALEIPQFVLVLVESPVFSVVLETFPQRLRSIEVLQVGEKLARVSRHGTFFF